MTQMYSMMTSSSGNIFRVTDHLCGEFTVNGELPTQRPVTRSFDVFFHLCLNQRLSKQSWGWWFETLSRPLWRHYNASGTCHPVLYDHEWTCAFSSQWRHNGRLKSPASPLFYQRFIHAQIKENIKAPRPCPFSGNSPGTGEFPAQMASIVENVSIWWRHYVSGTIRKVSPLFPIWHTTVAHERHDIPKLPTYRPFDQQLIRDNSQEHIKSPHK